uniref:Major facilitator superfamily (MFS) profile domain-containing protein n=1 Tax=Branchiostoma floridae TaxID=7739 RepID=C3Z1A4_BRAFL|eukprot:XP_002597791.1 hypothetical protein BRAFLDRAFT_77306 [Branchiostoma floridae]
MTNKARCSLGNFRKSRALVLIVAFLAMFVDTVLTTVLRESGRLFEFKLIEGPIRSTSCSILIRWNGSICYGWGDGTGLDDDVYERFSVATRHGSKYGSAFAISESAMCIGITIGLAETTVLTEIGELADTRHGSKYGSAFAISESAMCVGITIGLAVSGVLMDALGFFWMMLGLGLLNVLLSPAAILLRNVPSTEKMDKLEVNTGRTVGHIEEPDVSKFGLLQHGYRQLLSPHVAQTPPPEVQRHGHAVQQAGPVEQWRRRVVKVIRQLRVASYVDHREQTIRFERAVQLSKHAFRIGLVVYRVPREHVVERI